MITCVQKGYHVLRNLVTNVQNVNTIDIVMFCLSIGLMTELNL